MTRLLLTGAAGFIGFHTIAHLLAKTDWEIVGLDRLDEAASLAKLGKFCGPRFRFVWHDLRATVRPSATNCEALRGEFDYVVHLAAGSHVDRSVRDPLGFIADNVNGTGHLLEFVREHTPEAKVIAFGTDEVFGPAAPDITFTPWARHNPANPYAATKSAADSLAVAYAHTFGLRMIVTRCGNAFGPGQHPEKFVPIAIEKVRRGEVVPIHSVGGVPCSRLYQYVENVASAILHILEHGTELDGTEENGRYNITGGEEVSNVELVEKVGALLGKPVRWQLVENPPGRLRPDLRYSISVVELERLGWRADVSFDEGLKRTVVG